MDPNFIALQEQVRLRAAELDADLERCRLAPPFSMRPMVATVARAVRRVAEHVERWAADAAPAPTIQAQNGNGKVEWHSS